MSEPRDNRDTRDNRDRFPTPWKMDEPFETVQDGFWAIIRDCRGRVVLGCKADLARFLVEDVNEREEQKRTDLKVGKRCPDCGGRPSRGSCQHEVDAIIHFFGCQCGNSVAVAVPTKPKPKWKWSEVSLDKFGKKLVVRSPTLTCGEAERSFRKHKQKIVAIWNHIIDAKRMDCSGYAWEIWAAGFGKKGWKSLPELQPVRRWPEDAYDTAHG